MPIQLFCSASHFTHWCSVLYCLLVSDLYTFHRVIVFLLLLFTFAVYEQLWCAAVTVGEYWLQSLIAEVIVYIHSRMWEGFRWKWFFFELLYVCTLNNPDLLLKPKKQKHTKQRPAIFFSALYPLRSQLQDKYRNITKAHVHQQSLLSDTLSYRMIIRVNLKMY